MSLPLNSNIPNLIMMVRPKCFGYNHETAASNSFQKVTNLEGVSEKAIAEFDEAVQTLRLKGIEVKVFEDIEDNLPDSIFPNNWISQFPGQQLVTYPMLTANRRAEVRKDIIEFCMNRLKCSAHLDLTSNTADGKFLEGTGSMVINHENKRIYACVSPRTDLSILSKLAEKVGYRVVSFESLDAKGDQIYHTNVMMSIGSKVILVCLESVNNLIERVMLLESLKESGKEIIDLSYNQMNSFAGNALEVVNQKGELFYVMSNTALDSLTNDQRTTISRYSEILSVSIPVIELVGGGSVRCMMCGLYDYPK